MQKIFVCFAYHTGITTVAVKDAMDCHADVSFEITSLDECLFLKSELVD